MTEPIEFRFLFTASVQLYKFIMINPYELHVHPSPSRNKRIFAELFYWLIVWSSAVVISQQTIYLVALMQRTDDIVQIICSAAWIPVSLIAFECNLFTWRVGGRCTKLIADLELTYPKSQEEQTFASVRKTVEKWDRLSWIVCRTYLVALYTIFFQNLVLAIIGYLMGHDWDLTMPRLLWYPFDPSSNYWLQAATYLWECWGTVATTRAVVAVALFCGSLTMHLCIQLDALSRRFLQLGPRGVNVKEDAEKLVSLIREHNHFLDLCNELGSIFRVSLFVNYVLSSIVIGCFGFLILNEPVLSQKTEYIFDFICFMCYNSLFSFYGDSLMNRVSGVLKEQ